MYQNALIVMKNGFFFFLPELAVCGVGPNESLQLMSPPSTPPMVPVSLPLKLMTFSSLFIIATYIGT